MKKALITGITGQDGSYLAELLLAKGYEVHGMVRRSSSFNTGRIDHLYMKSTELMEHRLFLHYGDVSDPTSVTSMVEKVMPDEIYNLAAQRHGEWYGKAQEVPQHENTPFYPRSPYEGDKLYGFWIVKNYREAYGLHASNGILFNHESPRRGESFVTRKITDRK